MIYGAVEADGTVRDIIVPERRNHAAAAALLQRLIDGYPDEPRVVVTAKRARDAPALKKMLLCTARRAYKGVYNRAGNAHPPTRPRERALRRFTSLPQAPRFREPCGPIREHCCPGRHRLPAVH